MQIQLKEQNHVFAHVQYFDFWTGGREFKDGGMVVYSFHKSVCIVLNQLWLSPKTSQNQRSVITVLIKCQFACNRDLSVLTSMPFDGTPSLGKCYGAGGGRLSPAAFRKVQKNGKRHRSNGTSNIAGFL